MGMKKIAKGFRKIKGKDNLKLVESNVITC